MFTHAKSRLWKANSFMYAIIGVFTGWDGYTLIPCPVSKMARDINLIPCPVQSRFLSRPNRDETGHSQIFLFFHHLVFSPDTNCLFNGRKISPPNKCQTSFKSFFQSWLSHQQTLLDQLLTLSHTPNDSPQQNTIIEHVLSHYQQ